MSAATPERDANEGNLVVHQRNADLLHSNEQLRQELRRLHLERDEFERRSQAAMLGSQADREIRRAALNLMEDAILARRESQTVNGELEREITGRKRIEEDLKESERQLQLAVERYRLLNVELDQRVQDRTRDLRQREERLRELATQLTRVEQKERQRLAAILHDQIQQLLVAAKLQVDLAASDLVDPHRESLLCVVSILNDAIQATRNLSIQLVPPLLHDQGLPAAIGWLVARAMRDYCLTIETHIDDDANPESEELREMFFQAGQEFLLNVAKHAQARLARLELVSRDGQLHLTVHDQGVGFPLDRLESNRESFGLFQIRQRVESIGGTLLLESVPGGGTRVTAAVPWTPSGSEPLPLLPVSASAPTPPDAPIPEN